MKEPYWMLRLKDAPKHTKATLLIDFPSGGGKDCFQYLQDFSACSSKEGSLQTSQSGMSW